MILFEKGSPAASLTADDLRGGLCEALDKFGPVRKMLIVPPDITRMQSRAGELTRFAWEYAHGAVAAVLPALGTHCPMSEQELRAMFGEMPLPLFRPHNWRTDCTLLGEVPADYVHEISEGIVSYPVPVQINRLIFEGKFDCILSIGQVVPHEVAGMAGFSKNIFVGLGGTENIHKSHFLGAAYGIERILGRMDSPVRKVCDYAFREYLADLPIVHVITVVAMGASGKLETRGLFIGNDRECYRHAAELSQKVNMHLLDAPLSKVVVYLDPLEYKSAWLGNKGIYRTRMAIADGGELVVMAPGVGKFGEDREIDRLIRTHGYKGTEAVMKSLEGSEALQSNLSAAAHLIHGSSEGRFSVTYAAGGLSRREVEDAGFNYGLVDELMGRYRPGALAEGLNRTADGEEIFFISNPAIGLWALKDSFR